MPLSLPPWLMLVLAVPVLLAGERLVAHFRMLAKFNIPASVVGGLMFAALVLLLHVAGLAAITIQTKTSAMVWTWLVTPDVEWMSRPAKSFNLPFLVGYFTCIGLGAPVRVLRDGGRALLVLVGATTLLAIVQNVMGVAVAKMLGAPPLLGVVCGALTLVGGHGTALGFAPRFEEAGLAGAATIGAAAATFALVAGGLLAGPVGEWLLRLRDKKGGGRAPQAALLSPPSNFVRDVRALVSGGGSVAGHALILAACVKAGAWLSLGFDRAGVALPGYMGALLVGFALRAGHDAAGGTWLRGEVIGRIGAVLLPLFLAVTLAALNLGDLAAVAAPMVIILVVNIVVSVVFAAAVVWPWLGRDYEAAVMTAGFVGFGVGSTATAVAAMDAIAQRRGPAPRAFAVVPPTGGFLIDLTNAPVIAAFLNLLR